MGSSSARSHSFFPFHPLCSIYRPLLPHAANPPGRAPKPESPPIFTGLLLACVSREAQLEVSTLSPSPYPPTSFDRHVDPLLGLDLAALLQAGVFAAQRRRLLPS